MPGSSSGCDSSRRGCGAGECACKGAAHAGRADPVGDTDYGARQRHADADVTLGIDGREVTVPAGTVT
ncbi:hypothetical protein, partial [Burkholderia thailandensis]|uniref:hypothetical protein n=1 Tax=Burkholderia thailandensis TaxID=57975 RepID=UPI003455EFB5